MEAPAKKSNRGGRRPGAGRKKKGAATPSSLTGIDLTAALASPPPDEIEAPAQRHARLAVEALVKQLIHGASESARVAAANEILDRGYGKPAVDVGGNSPLLPFLTAAPRNSAVTDEVRTLCRQHAVLALEVLKKIADAGASESARVSAGKSILARAMGAVGAAKLPDDITQRAMGKKEEARTAAREGATGVYATPSPPRGAANTLQ